MSGFDKDWLALREPVDHAARDGELIAELAAFLEQQENPSIRDIGCGTGSTWRAIAGRMPERVQWTLLDYDPLLLVEAKRRLGDNPDVAFQEFDLNNLDALPFADSSVITASALFDLCSEAFCRAFVERLAAQKVGLYAALNYDGIVEWSRAHPLDAHMVAAFNKHQRTDKGFGKALGPDATACLEAIFKGRSYRVETRSSPWRMDHTMLPLQTAFIAGFRQPLLEMADLSVAEIDEWLSFRRQAASQTDCLCEVGHLDLLALPL